MIKNTYNLNLIKDFAVANNGVITDDIDNQIVGNYNYDNDGRLTKDVHDGITNIT